MARADIILGAANAANRSSKSTYLVVTPTGTVYNFLASQVDNSLYWYKSSDGGFTWGDGTLVKSIGTNSGFTVWYDKWTPGNSGTKIHIAYYEETGDDVLYRSLDTSNDSLGTEATIFAGASTAAPANGCISITVAIGGNLYCAFDIDGGTETGFYRSVDAGANWTSRTNVNEGGASTDYYLLAPGFAADNQDIICIFWDRSASEISRKLYDNSGDSWAETSIATGMVSLASSTACSQFSIAVDDANNKILLAAWSDRDVANADLRFWSIDESNITEGTNVVLNSTDDQQMCALGLATDTTTLYVFYGGKSDGSETVGTSINIYYKTSTDGGSTWGSETKVTNSARNYDWLYTCPIFTGNFVVAFQSQTSGPDNVLFSTPIPATSIFGAVVR